MYAANKGAAEKLAGQWIRDENHHYDERIDPVLEIRSIEQEDLVPQKGVPMTVTARFIKVITVRDPDSGAAVEVEIWKDPQSGAVFGVDKSYMEQIDERIPSPFNPAITLHLPERLLRW